MERSKKSGGITPKMLIYFDRSAFTENGDQSYRNWKSPK